MPQGRAFTPKRPTWFGTIRTRLAVAAIAATAISLLPPSTSFSSAILSLACGPDDSHSLTPCSLAGRGFYPGSPVKVVYRITYESTFNVCRSETYRRSSLVDQRGNFLRPPIKLDFGVYSYSLTITAADADFRASLIVSGRIYGETDAVHRAPCGKKRLTVESRRHSREGIW